MICRVSNLHRPPSLDSDFQVTLVDQGAQFTVYPKFAKENAEHEYRFDVLYQWCREVATDSGLVPVVRAQHKHNLLY